MTGRFPGLKFGAFSLVCVLCAAWMIVITGNLRPFANTRPITVELRDAAGLVVGDRVKVAGADVGRVSALRLADTVAVAEIALDDDVPVTDTWQAGVRWRNILGQRFLYLYPGDGGSPLADGDVIPADRTRRAADLSRVLDDLGPLLRALDPGQVNAVVAALDEALTGRTDDVRDLVDDLGALTAALASRDAEIGSLTTNAGEVLRAYAERDEEIRGLLTDSASIATTVAERNDLLASALGDIAAFQSELGRLLVDNDAEIRAMTDSLAITSATIGANRDDLELALATLPQGLATYLLISRWGQWFTIRTIAVQSMSEGEVVFCRTESGAVCSAPNGSGQATTRPPTASTASTAPQPEPRASAIDIAPARLPVTSAFDRLLPPGTEARP